MCTIYKLLTRISCSCTLTVTLQTEETLVFLFPLNEIQESIECIVDKTGVIVFISGVQAYQLKLYNNLGT